MNVNLYLFAYRGLFKTDKVVGTAHLKLEALENHCDIREIIDVSVGHVDSNVCKHLHYLRICMCHR